jgi:hypothetical protein
MGLNLAISRIYIPSFIKQRRLIELFDITSSAFQSQTPPLKGLPFTECLKEYALFTREKAENSIRAGHQEEVKNRLYQNALGLGQKLKSDFHINSLEEIMQMTEIVYKILGIKFQGDSKGEVIIHECFFSSFYSGSVCDIVSGLDKGLLAGLSGGGRLEFYQRITEGNLCCRARLHLEGSSL